ALARHMKLGSPKRLGSVAVVYALQMAKDEILDHALRLDGEAARPVLRLDRTIRGNAFRQLRKGFHLYEPSHTMCARDHAQAHSCVRRFGLVLSHERAAQA